MSRKYIHTSKFTRDGMFCNACRQLMPLPIGDRMACPHCGLCHDFTTIHAVNMARHYKIFAPIEFALGVAAGAAAVYCIWAGLHGADDPAWLAAMGSLNIMSSGFNFVQSRRSWRRWLNTKPLYEILTRPHHGNHGTR